MVNLKKSIIKKCIMYILIGVSLVIIGVICMRYWKNQDDIGLIKKELCVKEFLPKEVPKEIIVLYGDLRIPINGEVDIMSIMSNLESIILTERTDKEMEIATNLLEFVYDEHIISVVLNHNMLSINGTNFTTRENIYFFSKFCNDMAEERGQLYIATMDNLTEMKSILPKSDFLEIVFYYMGEGQVITDFEIITKTNSMLDGFKGHKICFENELYGCQDMDLVYPQEVIQISLQGNRITVNGVEYWITEDISMFEQILLNAAVVEYEKKSAKKCDI